MRGGLGGFAARRSGSPRMRPDAFLYVVLGAILTDVWRLHDLVPATRVARPSIVLIIVGLALFVAGSGRSRGLHVLRSPVVMLLGIFVALMLAGLPFSLDPVQSGRAVASSFLPSVMVGFLVAVSVRGVEDAEFLALGTLGGAVVHTLFVHLTVPVDLEGRWTELPHYDVNDLALMLVVMIPLTLYFMRRTMPTSWRRSRRRPRCRRSGGPVAPEDTLAGARILRAGEPRPRGSSQKGV
jgi:hypothetical protein